jgi:hypothetical protein
MEKGKESKIEGKSGREKKTIERRREEGRVR